MHRRDVALTLDFCYTKGMKKLFFALVLAAVFFLTLGCSSSEKPFERVYTAPFITKDSGIAYRDRMEATPFDWNGEMHVMVSHRDVDKIEIWKGQTMLSELASDLNFAAAYVESGTLYVFGTFQNQIWVIESTDLSTWTSPRSVFAAVADRTLYNVSVAKTSSGSYVMSYETCEPGTVCFNIRFATSPDLYSWTPAGSFFSPDAYAACPTIREIDGVYYMLYLKDFGHWATVVARSTDLVNWETSPIVVLSALETPGETINNSDVDLVEINGEVVMTYAIGDQQTYTHIKLARFQGTIRDFFAKFFN